MKLFCSMVQEKRCQNSNALNLKRIGVRHLLFQVRWKFYLDSVILRRFRAEFRFSVRGICFNALPNP
jgi:hypothetical protein